MEEKEEGIIYSIKGHCATIIINRPQKMNSITCQMGIELNNIAHEINSDDNIYVVVITGFGERAFSTGSDINLLNQYGTPFQMKNRQDYCAAIRNIKKPVISKIKGYALGGGLEIVLATDIRIATDYSIFAVSEVEHGWTSGSGATQVLARQIGYNRAAELVLSAKKIKAEEAYKLGIINNVLSLEDIDNYTNSIVEKMSKQSSIAMQLIKQNLRASQNMPMDIGLQYENDLFTFSFTTEDAAEGRLAFKEKREPIFNNKINSFIK